MDGKRIADEVWGIPAEGFNPHHTGEWMESPDFDPQGNAPILGFNPHHTGEWMESKIVLPAWLAGAMFQSSSYWRMDGKPIKYEQCNHGAVVSILIILANGWKGFISRRNA